VTRWELLFGVAGTLSAYRLCPLAAEPGEIAVFPAGIRFRGTLPAARPELPVQNYGAPFTFPGARPDRRQRSWPRSVPFLAPTAAYEDRGARRGGQKFGAICGRRVTPFAADGRGLARSGPVNTTPRTSGAGHGQLRPPGPVDLQQTCSPHRSKSPGQANVDFVSSRRAGWSVRNTFPPAWGPPQRDVGVMGAGRGGLRRQGPRGSLPGGATFTTRSPATAEFRDVARPSHGETGPARSSPAPCVHFERPLMISHPRPGMAMRLRTAIPL